ncbi:MAG: hypothetical protein QG622_2100 [Actinomycetota bacterium]|nr:hypothetical protein [Actinomycetota bacterium]
MPDIVAVAFYQLGYRPHESVVLVGLHGPRLRVGVVIRGDLPPPSEQRRLIAGHLEALRRHGHDHAIALVVTEAAVQATPSGPLRLPHRTFVRRLRRGAPDHGLHLLEVLAVGPSRWRSYSCTDPACCPADGFPLEEALNGRAAAEFVALGRVLADDEAGLVADVEPGPAGPSSIGEPLPLTRGDAERMLRRWRELLARPETATPADLDRLAGALHHPGLRDSVLLTLIPDSGRVPDELVAGVHGGVTDAVFETPPDRELLERGRKVLSAVARSAPPGRRADALALLAWAAWWAGHGTRGRLLAGCALDDVPDHGLASLIDRLLALGIAPEWARGGRADAEGPIG